MIPDLVPDLVAAINIRIDPEIVGGLTWHGLFTAAGIALGVWLALRLARRVALPEDDAMTIAIVGVASGIVGARLLWVVEHTDLIHDAGDVFAITDGGISIYGAVIGGVLGGFLYVSIFRPRFPKWMGLDAAAPGIIVGQAVGRIGDFINGEHFASSTSLPWAFRYTHPNTDGPWAVIAGGAVPDSSTWFRGQSGTLGEVPVPVHPVAGGYEPILDFLLLAGLLYLWWRGARHGVGYGWVFVTYVAGYALIRGLLALLRSDEQEFLGLSVPQVIAILTAGLAAVIAARLLRHPQPLLGERAAPAEPRSDAHGGPSGGGRGRREVRVRRTGGLYGR